MAIRLEPKYPTALAAINAVEAGEALCPYIIARFDILLRPAPRDHIGHRPSLCPERPSAACSPSPSVSASVPQAGFAGNVPGRL